MTQGWGPKSILARTLITQLKKNHVCIYCYLYLFMQVVVKPVSTAVPATGNVPWTVKTARVTYILDHVLIVHQDGLECNAIQVRWPLVLLTIKSYAICFISVIFFHFDRLGIISKEHSDPLFQQIASDLLIRKQWPLRDSK